MLNAGKVTGTIKNAFSDVFKLRFGREKIEFSFHLYPIIVNTMNTMLMIMAFHNQDRAINYLSTTQITSGKRCSILQIIQFFLLNLFYLILELEKSITPVKK
jgi:hypothetical protein